MSIDAHERLDDEGDETQRLVGGTLEIRGICLTRGVEQGAASLTLGGEAPVVVLARAVYAVEGFLVEQNAEAVIAGDALHQGHQKHVVVDGEVALLEDGRELKLVRGHLVVARLTGDGELEGVYLEVFHEGLHAVRDGAEVVVVHLLILRTLVTHQRTARHQQVGAGGVKTFVDEEVFLFPAEVHLYLAHIVVEEAADVFGGLRNGVERTEQRGFVVERLAGVGDEDGGDTEGIVDDEHGRGRIPGAVASGFEGVSDAAVGERRGVGFLLYEQLAAESLHHTTLTVVLHEGIMLLGRTLGERLEPVGVVGDAHLLGPLLHPFGDGVGDGTVETGTVVDDVDEFVIHFCGQVFVHFFAVEHVLAEVFGGSLGRGFHFHSLLLEGFLYDLESKEITHLYFWCLKFELDDYSAWFKPQISQMITEEMIITEYSV